MIEIQALLCRSNFGIPRRQATGMDFIRVNLLMAVIEKRGGLQIGDQALPLSGFVFRFQFH